MAQKNIEVNTDTLKSVHSRSTKELNEMVQSQLKDMQPQIKELSGLWEGPNHDTFMKTFDSHMVTLSEFNKTISLFLEAWQSTANDYDSCEETVSQLIG